METDPLMTTARSTGSAPWQIEIDCGPDEPAEYLSIKAVKLTPTNMVVVLPNGEQRTVKSNQLRKLLVMRTKGSES